MDGHRTLWRISKHSDLGGAGGEFADGRWHTKGSPVVYLAESHAGALLESLVHLEISRKRLPEIYTLLKVEFPESLGLRAIEPPDSDWRESIWKTQALGDAWLSDLSTPLARVPSAVVSETWNVLLNPAHLDAAGVQIVATSTERFDKRLFRFV